MARNKKKQTGSAKGFILLLIIIAAAVYYSQNKGRSTDMIRPETDQTTEKTDNRPEEHATDYTADTNRQSYSNKLEIPVSTTPRNEIRLKRTGYTLSYNNAYKTPNWVAWELTRQETNGNEERKNRFIPDPDLPEPRAEHSDYTNSGYDRGHMAPAADMKWSKKAMEESFYMSNICPQNQKLNRDDWNDLEETCRGWARKYGTVYIACGPIYDRESPKRIGEHKIAVPDRFFKVVLIYNRKNPLAMGFLFENKAHHQKLENYLTTVDGIEQITGLDFFSKLPDSIENRIEAQIPQLPSTR